MAGRAGGPVADPPRVSGLRRQREHDEEERRQKRVAQDEARQQEMYGAAAGRRTVGPQRRVIPNLAETKLAWASVIQKSSENKISVKNAWHVTQFESLPYLARELGENRDFHASGVTIESAAKVFSYKVDALLMQSSKVQTAITRGDDKYTDDDPTQGGAQAAGDGPSQNPAKRGRKRVVATATIAAPYDLNMKATEQQSSVDPLYAQTSSKFDQGGASGLLVLNCPLGEYIQVQLDSCSNTVFDPSKLPAPQECAVDFNAEAADVQLATYAARDEQARAVQPAPVPALPDAVDVPMPDAAAVDAAAEPAAVGVDAGADAAGAAATADDDASSAGGDHGADMCMADDDFPAMDVDMDDPVSEDYAAGNSPEEDGADEAPAAVAAPAETPDDASMLFRADREEAADAAERIRLLESAPTGAFRDGMQFTVADTLELDDDQQQEVYDMHQGQHGTGSSWQGPFDTQRWKIIRKTQALHEDDAGNTILGAATQGKAGATKAGGAGASRRRKPADVIDFDLTPADLAARLALAKRPETLLLQRGKDRRKAAAAIVEGRVTDDFLDPEVSRAHARQHKILLPEDHMVTTDVFFQLQCLPKRNLVRHQQLDKKKAKTSRHAGATQSRLAAEVEAALEAGQREDGLEAVAGAGGGLVGVDAGDAASAASGASADWVDDVIDFGFGSGGEEDSDDGAEGGKAAAPAGGGTQNDTLDSTLPATPLVMDPLSVGAVGGGDALHDASPALDVDVGLLGLALVDRPVEVSKTNVAFAKKAKVVDMKKLKDSMWEVLSRTPAGEVQQGRDPPPAIHRALFVNVIRAVQVVAIKRHIAASIQDITLPLYFIALLHLCNDKGLALTPTKEGSMDPRDMMIHSMRDPYTPPSPQATPRLSTAPPRLSAASQAQAQTPVATPAV